MKLIFVEIALILAIVSHTNSLAGRLHPTHTRTDTFSALKELIFGKFKKGGLTTFVKRLDGTGPILYKTYQRKPQQEAGAEGQGQSQPGWRPNINGNYDLLGIGWKKSGSNPNSESQAQAGAQPTGGLAGLANRLKTKKIEIQDHLKDKFETKKQVKNSILGGLGTRPRPGSGSDEMQLAPGSPEYERLKQYHLMGVVDMYRPPPTSAPVPGAGWEADEGEAAAAPTINKNKMKAKKKKKKKDKKAKKKKQKKIKKKMEEEQAAAAAASAAAKKKLKQQIKANKAAAAAGQGWKPPIAILPAGSSVATATATAANRIPVFSGGRNVVGSIGSTVSSTYKVNRKNSSKKGTKPKRKRQNQPPPNISLASSVERINSKLTRENPSRIGSSSRSESEETLKSDSFSSRLGLAAAASSAEDGVSYENIRLPHYSSYTAYYRVPNYPYSMFK